MLLGATDLLYGTVREREVDLSCRRAALVRRKAQASEQGLGHAVVALVLAQGPVALEREPALPAMALDQPQFLERREMTQGRGGRQSKRGGNHLEGDAAFGRLADTEDLQRLELTSCELLKSLHVCG